MATKKKLLQAAAGNAGGEALNVEDVFSTYLYTGTGAAHTITNGIDLAGEGGLVWVKGRDQARENALADTERGTGVWMSSNLNNGNLSNAQMINQFNSGGFRVGTESDVNSSGEAFASWTFRKAPKFFDIVTYTGDGVAGREIAHNLGSVPGSIFVKKKSGANNWLVYHRSLGNSAYARLNTTDESFADGGANWNSTTPTSTVFTLGSDGNVNDSDGSTYVAYVFAHNDGDGEFGAGDADIIKCGSYNGGVSVREINLGFEPQWVLIKNVAVSGANWVLVDNMRGASETNNKFIAPNTNSAEASEGPAVTFKPTGFNANGGYTWHVNDASSSSAEYIYMAIRRGTKVPESGTEVFAIDTQVNQDPPLFDSGFPVDFALTRNVSSTANWAVGSRLIQGKQLNTDNTSAESSNSVFAFDFMDGWNNETLSTNSNVYSWMWKRAPGYFDVVAFSGTGSAQTINHNLGVAPEMVWVKSRNNTTNSWTVTSSVLGSGNYMFLTSTGASQGSGSNTEYDNNQTPTNTVFYRGSEDSQNGTDYIAYLFSSLDNISKLGSYTADGNVRNIDCGFTSGARFVLIKNTAGGNWYVYDTARGIVAGNDPALELNTTSAEDNQYDSIDPYSAGFTLTAYGGSSPALNEPSETYIFYAIA